MVSCISANPWYRKAEKGARLILRPPVAGAAFGGATGPLYPVHGPISGLTYCLLGVAIVGEHIETDMHAAPGCAAGARRPSRRGCSGHALCDVDDVPAQCKPSPQVWPQGMRCMAQAPERSDRHGELRSGALA